MAESKQKGERSSTNGNKHGNGSRNALATTRPRQPALPGLQFSPLNRLRTEFDRVFDDFFRGWPSTWGEARQWTPGIDVQERDDAIIVRADAPGFEPNDFDVEIRGDNLVLCACQSEESSQEESVHWEKRELYESVPLPTAVDAEHIDAHYRNGVLTISLPKTEEAKGRKIEIKG
jgi:HSP20 family protein